MKRFAVTAGVAIVAFFAGVMVAPARDINDRPTYGPTGLPKNCRAIIQANINGYRARQYTAEEVISSMERNCGVVGYSWGQ